MNSCGLNWLTRVFLLMNLLEAKVLEIDRILQEELERGQKVGKPLSELSKYAEFMARYAADDEARILLCFFNGGPSKIPN
jgi:hypothetical protein